MPQPVQNTGTERSETGELSGNNSRNGRRKPYRRGKPKKNAGQGGANPGERPLFLEINKLIHHMKPITINGVSVEDLDVPVEDHIKSLLEDKENRENVYISFLIHPSDPDFPYDLDFLNVTLSIPKSYPRRGASPTITVLNDDIPRGFSANIEIGFQQIVATALHNRNSKKKSGKWKERAEEADEGEELSIEMVGGNDLLAIMRTLDKCLEKFLSMEKKETVKIVKVLKKYDREDKEEREERKKKRQQKKNDSPNMDNEISGRRNEEIERFKQRLGKNHIRLFKDSPQSTIFKLELGFQEGYFTIDIENSAEIVLKKLPVKIIVPKEYLSNPKKPLKMELDMSSGHNLKMIKSVEDQSLRLIFGKLINNMSSNFNYMAANAAKESWDKDSGRHWSITSQLNYFIENIQKFMNLRNDFIRWFEDNQLTEPVS
ncbi:DEKNAAC100584 [Brettanomyces naardenensis]|uniref:DEKNAAC100584 n=1 Tax=Brettanomyces naardenensis TaxID=13370 RepID=A0A448YG91_BRENA|nr:DEKNAAC100584 [Brettanomyces naardenensis]